MTENKLHVYHNGYDWWIVGSFEDLKGMSGTCESEDAWRILPEGQELTLIQDVFADKEDQIVDTKTIAEWIDERGEGLLASTEW
jgi:hypothetical protein